MRAQDSTFNIKIEREYDRLINHVNVIPQDISRVFLNILTNDVMKPIEKRWN